MGTNEQYDSLVAYGLVISDAEAALMIDPAWLPAEERRVLAHRLARQEARLAGDKEAGTDRFALAEAMSLDAPLDDGLGELRFPARSHIRWAQNMLDWAVFVDWFGAEPGAAYDAPAGLEARLLRWAAQQCADWARLTRFQQARLLGAGIRPAGLR